MSASRKLAVLSLMFVLVLGNSDKPAAPAAAEK
jgi:hypothetical protein